MRKKNSDEALLEHVMKNHSATLKERAISLSVRYQSVYARMKKLDMIRKKRLLSTKKETRRKEMNFVSEKENNIVYIDESGIKTP